MAVYRDAGQLVSDSSDSGYDVDERFWRVLQTLPADEPVPYALVMFGLLTDQLTPLNGNTQDRTQQAIESIDRVPSTPVSPQTQKGIQWILGQVQNSLSADRKQQVGDLLITAGIATRTEHPRANTADTVSDTSESEPESVDNKQQVSTPSPESKQSKATDATSHETAPESKNKKESDSGQKDTDELKTEHADESVECEHCGAAFATISDLISHSIQCSERPADAKYVCEHCGNKYISEKALADHLEDCSENDNSGSATRICSKCEASFESIQRLLSHRQSCGTQIPEDAPQPGEIVAKEATGRIVNYFTGDGYGFISTFDLNDSGPTDIFFHISDFPDANPQQKQPLQFNVKKTSDGYRAINIELRSLENPEAWDETFASKRPQWGRDT